MPSTSTRTSWTTNPHVLVMYPWMRVLPARGVAVHWTLKNCCQPTVRGCRFPGCHVAGGVSRAQPTPDPAHSRLDTTSAGSIATRDRDDTPDLRAAPSLAISRQPGRE